MNAKDRAEKIAFYLDQYLSAISHCEYINMKTSRSFLIMAIEIALTECSAITKAEEKC